MLGQGHNHHCHWSGTSRPPWYEWTICSIKHAAPKFLGLEQLSFFCSNTLRYGSSMRPVRVNLQLGGHHQTDQIGDMEPEQLQGPSTSNRWFSQSRAMMTSWIHFPDENDLATLTVIKKWPSYAGKYIPYIDCLGWLNVLPVIFLPIGWLTKWYCTDTGTTTSCNMTSTGSSSTEAVSMSPTCVVEQTSKL